MAYHLRLSKIEGGVQDTGLCQAKGDELVTPVGPVPWEESIESTRPARLEAKTGSSEGI